MSLYPRNFQLHVPTSLREAIEALEALGEDAKPLAGGQSLIPMMKLRIAAPSALVYLGPLKGELSYVRDGGDYVEIGALTTHSEVAESPLLRRWNPLVSEAAAHIGDTQVRNMGTIGGSLAHADPSADYPAAMAALGAEIVVAGKSGTRTVPAGEFFVDAYTTSLRPGELVAAVRVPKLRGRYGAAYGKVARIATDFAIVGVAVHVSVDERGHVDNMGIGLTGVGPTPHRPRDVEEVALGERLGPELAERIAAAVSRSVDPPTDLRATSEYRRRALRALTERALRRIYLDIARAQ